MVLKVENSEININGKRVVKALATALVAVGFYKAMSKPRVRRYVVMVETPEKVQKEQKSTTKKSTTKKSTNNKTTKKVESK